MNWEMLTLTFFKLYKYIKKLGQSFFHTLLTNLFKQRYTACYKYLNNLVVQYKNIDLYFFKNTIYAHNHFNKVIKF